MTFSVRSGYEHHLPWSATRGSGIRPPAISDFATEISDPNRGSVEAHLGSRIPHRQSSRTSKLAFESDVTHLAGPSCVEPASATTSAARAACVCNMDDRLNSCETSHQTQRGDMDPPVRRRYTWRAFIVLLACITLAATYGASSAVPAAGASSAARVAGTSAATHLQIAGWKAGCTGSTLYAVPKKAVVAQLQRSVNQRAGAARVRQQAVLNRTRRLHWIHPKCVAQRTNVEEPGIVPETQPDITIVETTAPNWAGYTAAPASGNFYTVVDGTWTVPTDHSPCTFTDNTYSSTWDSLGEGNSDSDLLAQMGSETDGSSGGFCIRHMSYYVWYELFPYQPTQQMLNFAVSGGDRISSEVRNAGSTEAAFVIEDLTKGTGASFGAFWPATYSVGNSATWITERTEIGSNYPELTDFATVPYSDAVVQKSTGTTLDLGNTHLIDRVNMTNCAKTTTLASAGVIGTNETSFTDTWNNYGTSEPIGC